MRTVLNWHVKFSMITLIYTIISTNNSSGATTLTTLNYTQKGDIYTCLYMVSKNSQISANISFTEI